MFEKEATRIKVSVAATAVIKAVRDTSKKIFLNSDRLLFINVENMTIQENSVYKNIGI